MTDIANAKIIILASDGFEQVELTTPKKQLEKGWSDRPCRNAQR